LQEFGIAALDGIAARILDAIAEDGPVSADAAVFLLRHYVTSERDDLREPLGVALAQALAAASGDTSPLARAAWLTLFVEAAAIADDERILQTARELVNGLRADWPIASGSAAGLIMSAASVDACLRAASLFDPSELVPPAIDELERSIGGAYRPGEGLRLARARADAHASNAPAGAQAVQASDPDALAGARAFQASDREALAMHVVASSALLTAFELTGRLPYSMLAEELMQPARRITPGEDIVVECAAARVFCRLATLHDDADYRAAAVLAPDADYREDAARILRACASRAVETRLAHAALYGIALRELISLR
jgi:hypothetical protein